MKYLRWFSRVVRPYRLSLTMMILSHVVLAACATSFVYICKQLVDSAVATMRKKHKHGELYYQILYYNYL